MSLNLDVSAVSFYDLSPDISKPGRLMETAKVGNVYVTRLTIDPEVVTGNLYHKETEVILFVTRGRVNFKFFHIQTREDAEFVLEPGDDIVHVPANIAMASKNVGSEPAVVVYFSNKPFRDNDDHHYEIY